LLLLGGGSSGGGFLKPAQVPIVSAARVKSKDGQGKEGAMPYKLGGPRFFGW
jgi:hypothetical protein